MRSRSLAALGMTMFAVSCGYHLAGRADLLPKTIHTVAIPAFGNVTTRYKLTDRLPEAISREFIGRTRYRVISNADQADAILRGAVVSYTSLPTIFDVKTGRASGVELRVVLQMSLTERSTGKVLYSRPSFEVRERYEISTDPSQYFEESDDALNRVSRAVAQRVVTGILENF